MDLLVTVLLSIPEQSTPKLNGLKERQFSISRDSVGWLGGFSAGLLGLTQAAAGSWQVSWAERPKLLSPHICQLVLLSGGEPQEIGRAHV